jgi:hypothetical protein
VSYSALGTDPTKSDRMKSRPPNHDRTQNSQTTVHSPEIVTRSQERGRRNFARQGIATDATHHSLDAFDPRVPTGVLHAPTPEAAPGAIGVRVPTSGVTIRMHSVVYLARSAAPRQTHVVAGSGAGASGIGRRGPRRIDERDESVHPSLERATRPSRCVNQAAEILEPVCSGNQ